MTRQDVLEEAVAKCMKEIYTLAIPKISWEDFLEENRKFVEKERKYYEIPEENRPSYLEYVGPKPYEFHYLPNKIMKDICESYVYSYRFDERGDFLENIETLKQYCLKPIVDKYIDEYTDENGNWHPGYRDYDHPDNLKKELEAILSETDVDTKIVDAIQNKFFEFLDKAGKFFNWTRYLSAFNASVYLGASPSSNKKAVIENWKKYRNQDIEIDDKQIEKDYYGEDD